MGRGRGDAIRGVARGFVTFPLHWVGRKPQFVGRHGRHLAFGIGASETHDVGQ